MATQLPTASERFFNGILPENPVYRQLLAMCPTLAITSTVPQAVTMAGATAFVLICANVVTAMMRKVLQPHLRILVFTVTIAAFVTVADRLLAAFLPDMSTRLGPYIPLIIVNCVIIARCEVVGSRQGLGVAFWDAVGQSTGFLLALLSISIIREIFGFGTVFQGWVGTEGIRLLPQSFPKWNLMILPPGAFFTLGILLGTANWITRTVARRKAAADNKAQAA
ncbi:MAG: electron transport complex subunit RsxE [Planctomycetes bacterium]|nr:electron transport complex subunit RsxE [Planctomycetota bacterium]